MVKRLFFSWQSDSVAEKTFIRKCLQEVCDKLDVEYDEDTRNNGAAEFVADVLLRKIRNSSVFVADLTPVGISPNGKKLANPNVCFETGFAECHHSRQQIILTFNEDKATFDDLPFDLSKRISIRFRLSDMSPQAVTLYKKHLERAISNAIKNYRKTPEQAKMNGPKLSRLEESLLYWGNKIGSGYVSKIARFNGEEAIAPGRPEAKHHEVFVCESDLRTYTLYESALEGLSSKKLMAKPSKKSLGNSKEVWFITENGEARAEQIDGDEVYGLEAYKG